MAVSRRSIAVVLPKSSVNGFDLKRNVQETFVRRTRVTKCETSAKNLKKFFQSGAERQTHAMSNQAAITQDLVAFVPAWWNYYKQKFAVTTEITVSKLFPAGFGWQAFGTLATQLGSSPQTLGFALMTGIGDCLGVSAGHLLFNLVKKNLGFKVSMANEAKVAAWLGTASFMSGTIWQPTVNMCAAMGLGFGSSAVLTGTVCGLTFFLGLRMGRHVYSKLIGHIEAPDSKNMTQDAGLCVGIAGAAGMFVSTDVSFMGNPFKPVFGVYETTAPLTGMVKAGGSTAAGFFGTHCLSYLGLAATRKH